MLVLNTKSKVRLYWIFVICISLIISAVFFVLQRGIVQSYEEATWIVSVYENMQQGHWKQPTLTYYLMAIYIKLFGISYDTQRLAWATFHFFSTVLSLDVSIRNNDNKVKVGAVPIFFFLMTFLHIYGISEFFGENGTRPVYAIRMNTIFASMVVIWLLFRNEKKLNNYTKAKKVWLVLVILVLGGVLCGKGDFAFYAVIICVPSLFYIIKSMFVIKTKAVFLISSMAILAMSIYGYMIEHIELLPMVIKRAFSGLIHGRVWYIGYSSVRLQLKYYIDNLLCIYGIDFHLDNIDMMTKWIYCFRSSLLLFLWGVIIYNIYAYLKNEKVELVEQITSWGAVLFFVAYIYAAYGDYGSERYLTFMLFYGVILICRNIEKYISLFHLKKYTNLAIIVIIFMFLSYDLDWNKGVNDEPISNVLNYIEQNGLHNGICWDMTLRTKIIVQSKGEHWMYTNEQVFGDEAMPDFLSGGQEYIDYIVVLAKETTTEKMDYLLSRFGYPDKMITCDIYGILVYNEGIWGGKYDAQTYDDFEVEYIGEVIYKYSTSEEYIGDIIVDGTQWTSRQIECIRPGNYKLELQLDSVDIDEENILIGYQSGEEFVTLPVRTCRNDKNGYEVLFKSESYLDGICLRIESPLGEKSSISDYSIEGPLLILGR